MWVSAAYSLPMAVTLFCLNSWFRPSLEEALQWRDSLDKLLQNSCKFEMLLMKVSEGIEARDVFVLPMSFFPSIEISSVFKNEFNKGRCQGDKVQWRVWKWSVLRTHACRLCSPVLSCVSQSMWLSSCAPNRLISSIETLPFLV